MKFLCAGRRLKYRPNITPFPNVHKYLFIIFMNQHNQEETKLTLYKRNQQLVTMVSQKIHSVLLASPGIGHLIPTIELGKRLTTHHNFDVTIFVVTTATSDSDKTKSHILQQISNLNSLDIIVTPPVDVSDKLDPNNPSLGLQIVLTMIESLPFIRSEIQSMKNPPSVLIVDIFGTAAFPMAHEAFSRHAKNHEPLSILGCEPVRFEDTLETFVAPWGPIHKRYVEVTREIIAIDGILVNTWHDLEPGATKAVIENGVLGRFVKGPVYPIGPLVRTGEPEKGGDSENLILSWLDQQPAESVIYLSFGSGGTMSKGQMRELAYGLELSQQRFIWVVRRPTEDNASATFFNIAGADGTIMVDYLPKGFLNRTKDVGLCVPMWAPQAEILKHPSTGGFLTHCGWNSVLESIHNGVPMVAWPLYAEQKMNATMLSEELGVAVKATKTVAEGGVVCREKIAEVIRKVMVDDEGVAMRVKVKEYKVSGEKALSVFGSSHESLCKMAKDCELHLHHGSEAKGRGA
ncbi:putative UDP-glucuronosyl/UDP-glucosyltransferase [Medicago truncatula]|uniref:Glycosyltransferase n=1 Tax=Medicago truncatula TaxID=3880 RepID=A0A072UD50_MEDTR|nr:UDP-glucosyltransferase family protein [Medicago truncatula]RHN54158.1 putative UDP-glucuronosyl/UDP-glucosyltransferase [Medicago truncatula]